MCLCFHKWSKLLARAPCESGNHLPLSRGLSTNARKADLVFVFTIETGFEFQYGGRRRVSSHALCDINRMASKDDKKGSEGKEETLIYKTAEGENYKLRRSNWENLKSFTECQIFEPEGDLPESH